MLKSIKSKWSVVVGIGTIAFSIIDRRKDWGILESVFGGIKWFFMLKFYMPMWGIILVAFSLPALGLLIIWVASMFLEEPEKYPLSEYNNDTIMGIRWCWQMYSNGIDADTITPRCPECGTLLEETYESMSRCALFCSHCTFRKTLNGPISYVKKNVYKEIERKQFDGSYKEALAAQSVRKTRKNITGQIGDNL